MIPVIIKKDNGYVIIDNNNIILKFVDDCFVVYEKRYNSVYDLKKDLIDNIVNNVVDKLLENKVYISKYDSLENIRKYIYFKLKKKNILDIYNKDIYLGAFLFKKYDMLNDVKSFDVYIKVYTIDGQCNLILK